MASKLWNRDEGFCKFGVGELIARLCRRADAMPLELVRCHGLDGVPVVDGDGDAVRGWYFFEFVAGFGEVAGSA